MKRKRASGGSAPQKKAATAPAVARAQAANYQVSRQYPRQPKAELKAFDLAETTSSLAVAGAFVTLNAMPQGPDFFQRIGRKTYMKSLHIKGVVYNVATSVTDYGRMIVVYDSQPNAALPNLATVLQDANAAAASSAFSEINLNERERFRFLRDKRFYLPSCTNAANVLTNNAQQDQIVQSLNINEFIDLKGMETVYNAVNGGTIADITSGSLFVLWVSNLAGYDSIFTTRLRFYD